MQLPSPLFDDKTNVFLARLQSEVTRNIEDDDPWRLENPGLPEAVGKALVDLARAGQRDAGQLKRYAHYQGMSSLCNAAS
jgi:hypothetical protein